MNAQDTGNNVVLDRYAPHPVDGHLDYEWYEDVQHGQRHEVYWVPQVDAILPIGTARPNPDRTPTSQLPAFLVEDTDGEWIASGDTIPELARLLVLHFRAAWLAARHAYTAVDTVTAATDMDTTGWQLCIELADLPTWWDEFGPQPQPLSGTHDTPTIHTLLRDLGLDPDQEARPDGPLRPSLERYYERAFHQAWHNALLQAARRHLRTPRIPVGQMDGHNGDHNPATTELSAAAAR